MALRTTISLTRAPPLLSAIKAVSESMPAASSHFYTYVGSVDAYARSTPLQLAEPRGEHRCNWNGEEEALSSH